MRALFQKLQQFYLKYERHITTVAFVVGFVVDNLTLTRVDLLFDNLVLFSYLLVATASILFFNMTSVTTTTGFFGSVRSLVPLTMQFAFGGLFSGFFIFYTQSASLAASWPFLLLLLLLLIGNEALKKRYSRFVFQMSMLFFVLFSYLIFFFPILLHEISARVFILSGVASLFAIVALIGLLLRVMPAREQEWKKALTVSIGGIFLFVNIFYFANIIPPIPLSLKEAGVYHSVTRTEDNAYMVSYEQNKWPLFFGKTSATFHKNPGESVYFYSAVFAPTDLDTNIFHSWQYYDESIGEWREMSRIGFPIIGGRDGGYRGYSMKTSVVPGDWRVQVETARGQILGRVKFIIVESQTSSPLKTEMR
ncbi:MAG: DUF2914 domain-containing protein [Patescibacteria group bacterium]|nr:DUF2914 domain-containing protein [Patescibacteria group bacterium]